VLDETLPTNKRVQVNDDFFFQHLLNEEDNVEYPLGVEGNTPDEEDDSELLQWTR
jgi:hypothetical protein